MRCLIEPRMSSIGRGCVMRGLSRRGDRLVGDRAADQRLGGGGHHDRRCGDRAEGDAGVGHGVAIELDVGAAVDDGDVHLVARDEALPGGAAAGGRGCEVDRHHELAELEHVAAGTGEELGDQHVALTVWPRDLGDGANRHHRGQRVTGRRRVPEVPAEAGAPLDRGSTDHRHRLDERGVVRFDLVVVVKQVDRRGGANREPVGGAVAELHQLRNVFDIDEAVDGLRAFPGLHDDVRAAGQYAGAFAAIAEQIDRFAHRRGALIGDCLHCSPPSFR